MRLAKLTAELRDTSDRFGGIPDFLEAAGELDAAISAFFQDQDTESLARLNGAMAKCHRLDRWRSESNNAPMAR